MGKLRQGLIGLISIACTSDPGTAGPDGGAVPQACEAVATPDDWVYPEGPYGGEVGSIMEEFELENCDAELVKFGDILSEAELVLVTVGAGWCQPCIEESEVLQEEFFIPYCARGLRIVDILFQDEDAETPTTDFCKEWTAEFGMTFPVLMDRFDVMGQYFEDVQAQTPLNFLIDKSGEIVYLAAGTVPVDLASYIDDLLPQ